MKIFRLLRLSFAALVLTTAVATAHANVATHRTDPGVGEFTIAIPETLNAVLAKETNENSVRYMFKKADGSTQFLFAVNKVSEQQWMLIKDQLPSAKLQAHKNGFIYYVERTDRNSLKGHDKDAYAGVYNQLDAIIRSIDIRG